MAATISGTYAIPNSPFASIIFDSSLQPNMDNDPGNYFGRNGMIGMTGNGGTTRKPIQKMQNITNKQGKEFRSYLGGFFTGEPDIGDGVASEDVHSLDRHYFNFKTVAIYGISVEVPDDQENREQAIPIISNYQRALREWWSNLFEEITLVYGLAGMRGQARNLEVMTTIQADGNAAAVGAPNSLTKTMRGLAKANPLYPPQVQFGGWHATLNPSNPLSPSTATKAAGRLTSTDVRAIASWLEEQNRKLRGVAMMPAELGMMKEKADKSGYERMQSEDWVWLITPSVKRDLFDQTGAGTLAEYQLALAQSMGRNQGQDDYSIGRWFGFCFYQWKKLPRYLGGANKDVPISRTMILGSQSAVVGYRSFSIPDNLLARLQSRTRRIGSWGTAVRSWVVPVNKARRSTLETQANIGVSSMYWEDNQGNRIDKGRIAVDVAVESTSYDNVI